MASMRAVFEGSPTAFYTSSALQEQERWYVVHTQPHREAQAQRQLENQAYRVFLRRFFRSRRHARKFETVLAPLFSRYMFIVLDLGRDRWRSVNGTLGVDRLLMRAGEPEPVPHGLVEQLIEAAADDGVVRCGRALQEGQTIRVTAGPFAELVGTLEHLDDHKRVRVLLDILGGKIPVLLPEAIVAPTEST
jgi:transcription elongation factor/antiterminator RfaH